MGTFCTIFATLLWVNILKNLLNISWKLLYLTWKECLRSAKWWCYIIIGLQKNVQTREWIIYLRQEAVSFPWRTKINIQTDQRSKDSKRERSFFSTFFCQFTAFLRSSADQQFFPKYNYFFLSDTFSSRKSLREGKYLWTHC